MDLLSPRLRVGELVKLRRGLLGTGPPQGTTDPECRLAQLSLVPQTSPNSQCLSPPCRTPAALEGKKESNEAPFFSQQRPAPASKDPLAQLWAPEVLGPGITAPTSRTGCYDE